jgi:hypothetical protein
VATFHKSKELSQSFQNALGANSLALLITAVIQTARDQLTLFHAICIIHLLTLLGLTTLSSRIENVRFSLRGFVGMSLYFLSLCMFIGFNFYVWITAPSFGSQPQCNASTVYVVFGADVLPTLPVFRWILVAVSCIGLVSIIISLLLFSKAIRETFTKRMNVFGKENSRQDFVVLGVSAHLGTWVYAVTTFEQTLQHNVLSPDEFQWSFGQILALVLLIGPLFDLLTSFQKERENMTEVEDTESENSAYEVELQLGQFRF